MRENLAERQASILRALVREYIRTGEPVGSKWLAARARMNVSPATIRNDMAHLEALGYLHQPHTSAGRVPTDRGYRFVVDEIRAPRALAHGQQRALEEELIEEPGSVDDLMHRASEVVAKFTHHAAAILSRRARTDRLRRLELFPLGTRLASLVLIAENGRVEQRMLSIEESMSDLDVENLGRKLARALAGGTLDQALRILADESKHAQAGERTIVDGIVAGVRSLRDAHDQVVVGGVANLAGENDFERETLHRMYEALERQTAVLELLATAFDAPLSVRIGSELAPEEFRSCSVVVANFGGGDALGQVGVIGPTRMDYERVIATANTVARMLGSTLDADRR